MRHLQVDAGPEFNGELLELARLYGTTVDVIHPSNKFKHGLCERHGGIAKVMLLKVIAELSLTGLEDIRYGLSMVLAAKNHLLRRNGYSPAQCVLGCQSPLATSLCEQAAGGRISHAANQAVLDSEALRLQARIRAAAHASFLWLDAHEGLRRAMRARSRPPKLAHLAPGTEVCYYRQLSAHRRTADTPWAVEGPATAVSMEGLGNVWLRHNNRPLKVAVENLRLASATWRRRCATCRLSSRATGGPSSRTGRRRPPPRLRRPRSRLPSPGRHNPSLGVTPAGTGRPPRSPPRTRRQRAP